MLRQVRGAFLAVGIFSFFLNLLYLVSPLYMLQIYDRVLTSGQRPTLLYLTIIAAVALLVLGILEALRGMLLTRIGAWTNQALSGDLVSASVRATLAGREQGAQALRDLNQVQSFIGTPSINPFFDAPWVPVFVACVWILHPWLGVLALVSAIVLFLLAFLNDRLTRKGLGEAGRLRNRSQLDAERAIRNSEVVQAMAMMPAILRRWEQGNKASQDANSTAMERAAAITGLSRFLRLGVQVGILGLGALLVLQGELTAGGMIAASILLGRALAPVEMSISSWRAFVGAVDAYGRLRQLLGNFGQRSEPMPLPTPQGRIDVQDVTYRPPGSATLTLNRVRFDLSPGEVLAVIGPSAAGKSTLCRILCGVLEPLGGNVRLDGADLRSWPSGQLGAAIGYLPQDVELFAGTVRQNIARMTDGDPEAVVAAAKNADVHELILQLSDGYDTEIGPGGSVLSAGQRQRIGLARALYGDPKIVILDEPNANLDQEGEAALTEAIAGMKARGATVILVAHRTPMLVHVDKILLLARGAVEMFDTRDKVLAELKARRDRQVEEAARQRRAALGEGSGDNDASPQQGAGQ